MLLGGWGTGQILFFEHTPRWMGLLYEWRRKLTAWEEEMLRECQILVSIISLQAQYSDRWRWQWQPDPDTDYTVRGAYQLLTTLNSIIMDDVEHLIWHPEVPLKVSILLDKIKLFSY
ncbi:hypothetical protein L195_g052969, partial [Trifolium pratense]